MRVQPLFTVAYARRHRTFTLTSTDAAKNGSVTSRLVSGVGEYVVKRRQERLAKHSGIELPPRYGELQMSVVCPATLAYIHST